MTLVHGVGRNAHLVAMSDCFFAFQQKVEQFFRLLEGVPRAPEFEREEVHPVLGGCLFMPLCSRTKSSMFER
jgi:hypothetical protein